MGMSGVWLCMGDFKQEAGKVTQQVAADLLGHEPAPTCQGYTAPDQIWMSSEAIELLQHLRITEDFMEHSTVCIGLKTSTPTDSHDQPRFLGQKLTPLTRIHPVILSMRLVMTPLLFCGLV